MAGKCLLSDIYQSLNNCEQNHEIVVVATHSSGEGGGEDNVTVIGLALDLIVTRLVKAARITVNRIAKLIDHLTTLVTFECIAHYGQE